MPRPKKQPEKNVDIHEIEEENIAAKAEPQNNSKPDKKESKPADSDSSDDEYSMKNTLKQAAEIDEWKNSQNLEAPDTDDEDTQSNKKTNQKEYQKEYQRELRRREKEKKLEMEKTNRELASALKEKKKSGAKPEKLEKYYEGYKLSKQLKYERDIEAMALKFLNEHKKTNDFRKNAIPKKQQQPEDDFENNPWVKGSKNSRKKVEQDLQHELFSD